MKAMSLTGHGGLALWRSGKRLGGHDTLRFPHILGCDFSGVVVARAEAACWSTAAAEFSSYLAST
jgi:hypothetical protein